MVLLKDGFLGIAGFGAGQTCRVLVHIRRRSRSGARRSRMYCRALCPSGAPVTGILVLVGPSGVGKTTVSRRLVDDWSRARKVVTCTTRAARRGERNGRDYWFVTRSEFEQNIARGVFVEWVEYDGEYYGTPRAGIGDVLQTGKWAVMELEDRGARAMKQAFRRVMVVRLEAPSPEELRVRLRGRGDTKDLLERRLCLDIRTPTAGDLYDMVLVNSSVRATSETLRDVLVAGSG